ncbi:MAG: class I SAM-dependent methyltransferase, partial [Gemmatimonadota bacterium]
MDPREVRVKYDGFAPSYDWAEGLLELIFGIRRLRRGLLASARGKVLDVGVGTGNSLRSYPTGCDVTGVDISSGMIRQAAKKNGNLGVSARWVQMDAHRLAFADSTFDTVVDTLCLCTYDEPVRALEEMARV